jgi:hypothetical protein
MKKDNCKIISDALIQSIKEGSQLEEIVWSQDLIVSQTIAQDFINQVGQLPASVHLKKLEFNGIFNNKENRVKIKENFKNKNIELILLKLNPCDSDDDSDAHDYTEEKSKE